MGSFAFPLPEGTCLSSRSRHIQAKDYLENHAKLQKFVKQCVICQRVGYDEKKLEERTEALAREQVKKYYEPILLDSLGRCTDCAAAPAK